MAAPHYIKVSHLQAVRNECIFYEGFFSPWRVWEAVCSQGRCYYFSCGSNASQRKQSCSLRSSEDTFACPLKTPEVLTYRPRASEWGQSWKWSLVSSWVSVRNPVRLYYCVRNIGKQTNTYMCLMPSWHEADPRCYLNISRSGCFLCLK